MHEIRPGAIIGRVFQIYREQAATLLPAALLVYAVQLVAALLFPSFFVVAAVVGIVVGVFYQGMVVRLVEDVQDGRRDHSIGELFRSVGPVALPLFGLAIVAGFAIAIGFVLIIIPGLILLTWWSVAAPALVIERAGVFGSLGRSRDLVRGNGWNVFGTILLVFLINIAVNIVAAIIGAAIGDDTGRGVVDWIAATLTAPIVALTSSVLYFALVGGATPAQQESFEGGPERVA
jgi:hypothetical protein